MPRCRAECLAFAAAVEDTARAGNAAGFGALVDWDAILKTATGGIKVPEASRDGFIQGVKSSMNREQGLVPQIIATVKSGGSYKFLHVRTARSRRPSSSGSRRPTAAA